MQYGAFIKKEGNSEGRPRFPNIFQKYVAGPYVYLPGQTPDGLGSCRLPLVMTATVAVTDFQLLELNIWLVQVGRRSARKKLPKSIKQSIYPEPEFLFLTTVDDRYCTD